MKAWLISAAIVWSAGHGAGVQDATLTRNPTSGTGPFILFNTSSRIAPSAGVEARLTRYFGSRAGVEGFARWNRPSLHTTSSNDVESATGTDAVLQETEYLFGGSLLYRFGHARLRPFVFGGAGRVHGLEVHAGGGVERAFGRFSLRIDAGAASRMANPSFEPQRQTQGFVSVGLGYMIR